jgi:hypothetical protein
VLGSLDERAKQHDGAATALMADVCQPLKLLIKETTQKRQDHIKEVVAQRAELDKHVINFDKVRVTQQWRWASAAPYFAFARYSTQKLTLTSFILLPPLRHHPKLQRRKVYDKVEKEAEKAKIQLKKYEENPAQQKKVSLHNLHACPSCTWLHLTPTLQSQIEPARREFAKKAMGREEAERVLDQVRLFTGPLCAPPLKPHHIAVCVFGIALPSHLYLPTPSHPQHLSELNRERIVHYHTTMPNLFDQMQAADEYRAMSVVNTMSQMLRTLENAAAAEGRALASANAACQSFDKVGGEVDQYPCLSTHSAPSSYIVFTYFLSGARQRGNVEALPQRRSTARQSYHRAAKPQPRIAHCERTLAKDGAPHCLGR